MNMKRTWNHSPSFSKAENKEPPQPMPTCRLSLTTNPCREEEGICMTFFTQLRAALRESQVILVPVFLHYSGTQLPLVWEEQRGALWKPVYGTSSPSGLGFLLSDSAFVRGITTKPQITTAQTSPLQGRSQCSWCQMCEDRVSAKVVALLSSHLCFCFGSASNPKALVSVACHRLQLLIVLGIFPPGRSVVEWRWTPTNPSFTLTEKFCESFHWNSVLI